MSNIVSSSSTSCSVKSSESSLHRVDKVFIFDIEEITMLSNSQIAQNAQKFPKLPIHSISKKLELLKSKLGFDDLIDEDVVDDGADRSKVLIAELNVLRRKYEIMSTRQSQGISNIIEDLRGSHVFSNRWNIIRKCLELINRISQESRQQKFTIVAISRDGLAHGAIQLIMASLAPEIQFDNIYSTARKSVKKVLKTIMNRFGSNCGYGLITSKENFIETAQNLGIIAWKVETNADYDNFFDRLDAYLPEGAENSPTPPCSSFSLPPETKPMIIRIEKQQQRIVPPTRQIQIKQEPIEEVQQPVVVQNDLRTVRIKREPIDRVQEQIPIQPIKPKPRRNVDLSLNEELCRAYPIPEDYRKTKQYFLKSQKRIDEENEVKRFAEEKKQASKEKRRSKAALLGKGITTRRQSQQFVAVTQSPIREGVSETLSFSQEQLETRVDGMEEESQRQTEDSQVQSSPVNIENCGRGPRSKTQLQSKRVAEDSSDLDGVCDRKKVRKSNGGAQTQELMQEESTTPNASIKSTHKETVLDRVRAIERAQKLSTQIQRGESDQPSTSQSMKDEPRYRVTRKIPLSQIDGVWTRTKNSNSEVQDKALKLKVSQPPLNRETKGNKPAADCVSMGGEDITAEHPARLIDNREANPFEYETQQANECERDQRQLQSSNKANIDRSPATVKQLSPSQQRKQVTDQQVRVQQKRHSHPDDRVQHSSTTISRTKNWNIRLEENMQNAEVQNSASVAAQKEAQMEFEYEELIQKLQI